MKVLLVDTNRAAVPIYQTLLSQGHEVWVVGRNPSEPLAKICPRFVQMDYADTKRLPSLVKKHKFSALVPGCTDVSYRACAQVSRGRFKGIDLPEVVDLFQRKDLFRGLASSLGLPVAASWTLGKPVPNAGIIIKPVDSFSGRGISILPKPSKSSFQKAVKWAKKNSPRGAWLAEEFIPGQLFSYSAFVRKGRVAEDFVVQENCVADPFAVDLSRVSYDFPVSMRRLFKKDVEAIATHLSLCDGLVHAQLIVRGDRYWFIEITRRCPGDLYSLLVEYSTGFSYAGSYTAPFVGQKLPKNPGQTKFVIRHTACPKTGDRPFWGISFREEVKMRHFIPLATLGQSLPSGPLGRAALMFLAFPSQTKQTRYYDKLLQRKLYDFS
jgi:formate-dependent phosphoribosylglycinamide formyltransferase (GAR transformylase)